MEDIKGNMENMIKQNFTKIQRQLLKEFEIYMQKQIEVTKEEILSVQRHGQHQIPMQHSGLDE